MLVVGLGVTGAGVALDAAARGLSVAALDAHDLAFGTSRWSSKLVHGGLRYLAHGDVAVAYECARERGVLLTRTAPHLTRPLPVLLPLTSDVSTGVARLHRAGITAGDALRVAAGTPAALLPRARRVTAAQARRWAPGLRANGLRGGNLNWDGQLEDDARLVVAIARTAAGFGARILTRCRVTALSGDGAQVRDERSGASLTVRARSVVNAAGVWAGSLVDGLRLRPSRGTHVVLHAEAVGGLDAELLVPVPGRRAQFVFAVPQPGGVVFVGTTDEPVDTIEDVPVAPESDVTFLLDVLGTALETPATRSDVLGTFAGLRPLLDDGNLRSADVSRRHAIRTSADGVVTVVGGKLTTYRRMAQEAVDTVVRLRNLPATRCRTSRLPLVGAAPRTQLPLIQAPGRLVRRYGTEAPAIAALSTVDSVAGLDVSDGELRWAVRHEGALDVEDLLDRRTRIGLIPADRAAALPTAQAILADER